jgi:hypothetical protein
MILVLNTCHPSYLELGVDDDVITFYSRVDLWIHVSCTVLFIVELPLD